MSEAAPLAQHDFSSGAIAEALEFLKRTRGELRTLRMVRVWADRFRIYDINGDSFEIAGLGYGDPEIVKILDTVNTAYRRDTIHQPTDAEYKQFKTGRRYAWAADRVM